ncbi:MAG: molybdopterin-dependent oxidoreductase [Candidatus Velthaea sp.]
MKRKLFVASSLASAGLAGCTSWKANLTQGPFHNVLATAETLNHRVIGTHGMAKLYTDADVDHEFRVNGLDTPHDSVYGGLAEDRFRRYKLIVDGLAERPQAFALNELRALPLQTQITRHDCVEGWSAIGKWRGVRLATVLASARPKPEARYAIFHCYDRDDQGTTYYESLDLQQAAHPQTVLALDLNDKPLDPDHGAPVRLRIPTQLGYKSAKWVHRIELASTFTKTGAGNGGYWEDQGYEYNGRPHGS